jgi:uncharacterized protein YneF (UPF0154 family)
MANTFYNLLGVTLAFIFIVAIGVFLFRLINKRLATQPFVTGDDIRVADLYKRPPNKRDRFGKIKFRNFINPVEIPTAERVPTDVRPSAPPRNRNYVRPSAPPRNRTYVEPSAPRKQRSR